MSVVKKLLKNPAKIVFVFDKLKISWLLSSKVYLKLKYKACMDKKLNLKNPKTFNEKLQWLKLYDRKDIYTTMVDKYEAKKYVAEIIGEEHIIPTLGVWDKFDDIDFDTLPNQFVLKCTHDSGGLVICRDKSKLDKMATRNILEKSLKNKYFFTAREWPYKNVKPRIIAEKYMQDNSQQSGLVDYKFYCFGGETKFLYISQGLENHKTARISFLNLDWTFAPFKRTDYKPFDDLPQKPKEFEKMIDLTKQLSKNIPFLRVDLYEIEGKIYFSELTFSPCGGMMRFEPEEWDYKFGEYIKLPIK